MPILVVFAGLPGVGKTTLARGVSRHLTATYLRVDTVEHRRRVETRAGDIPGLTLPSWEAVLAREYRAWDSPRIVVDTAGRDAGACVAELLARLPPRAVATGGS